MEKVIGIIYRTTNLINGRMYIGQHLVSEDYDGSFDGYLGSGTLLKKAIQYYGESSFERITLRECYSREELNEAEEYYLRLYDCATNPTYYNLINDAHLGGRNSGYHHDEDTKKKIGKHSGESRKGKSLSESHKASISKSLSTPDNRERQSKSISGRIKINNGEVEKLITPNELPYYLSQGFKKGRLPSVIESMSEGNKGKSRGRNENQARLVSEAHKGRIAVSRGEETRKIYPEDLEEYLADGWTRGMSESFKRRRSESVLGKVHVYRGEEQRFVTKEESEILLSEGWLLGLPPSQCEKIKVNHRCNK